MFERFYKNRYGYSRWDGTQRIEGLDADDILKALSDDYLENGNLQQALKRLMQDGVRGEDGQRAMGLREMMERMRKTRNEQLSRYNMASGVMDDLREKLEEIKQLEREGIQERLDNQGKDQQNQQGQPGQEGQPGEQSQEGPQGSQSQAGSQSQSGQAGQPGQSGQSGEG
ncbi:MAG TPA: VWA domain-containing protein, partial [Ktedonobacteraceae bacterium]